MAERVVPEDRRLLHHDRGAAGDTLVDRARDLKTLAGLEVHAYLVGLHLPVDGPREQTPREDRISLEDLLVCRRQRIGVARNQRPRARLQALRRLQRVGNGTHFGIRGSCTAPAEDEARPRTVDPARARRQLHPRLVPQRLTRVSGGDAVREPIQDFPLEEPVVGPSLSRAGLGRAPQPGAQHLASLHAPQLLDVGGDVVEPGLAVLLGHLDRVARAPAATPIGRSPPFELRAHSVGRVDRGAHEPPRHGARHRVRSGRAARGVERDDDECRPQAGLGAAGSPPDDFVECDPANRGGRAGGWPRRSPAAWSAW
jgi:hypothetical protein